MSTIQKIVEKKLGLHQPLTVKQLEAYRKASIAVDCILKKFPYLRPRELEGE